VLYFWPNANESEQLLVVGACRCLTQLVSHLAPGQEPSVARLEKSKVAVCSSSSVHFAMGTSLYVGVLLSELLGMGPCSPVLALAHVSGTPRIGRRRFALVVWVPGPCALLIASCRLQEMLRAMTGAFTFFLGPHSHVLRRCVLSVVAARGLSEGED
jgi:hypothetical protein